MHRLMTATLNAICTLGLLGSLAIGVQGENPSHQATPNVVEPPIDETARLMEENRPLNRQLVDAATQAQEKAQADQPQADDEPARPVIFGSGPVRHGVPGPTSPLPALRTARNSGIGSRPVH